MACNLCTELVLSHPHVYASRKVHSSSVRRCFGAGRPGQVRTLRSLTSQVRTRRDQLSSRICASVEGGVDVDVEEVAMERMEKSLEACKRSFATVRTGRANPSMLDRIDVDYYGAPTPLKQLAGISVPESTTLVIQPYDISAMQVIEKAIMQSDLDLTPSNDGKVIRLKIPQLTVERRKELSKTVAKLSEEGKVAVRNIRRDAMKQAEKLEKEGVLSENARAMLEDDIQKLTDGYIKQIESMTKEKQADLTKV